MITNGIQNGYQNIMDVLKTEFYSISGQNNNCKYELMCLCLQTESYLISIGTYEILNETEENDSLNGNLSTGNDTVKGDICFYIVKLLFVKYHKQYVKKLVNDLKEISNMIILKFN